MALAPRMFKLILKLTANHESPPHVPTTFPNRERGQNEALRRSCSRALAWSAALSEEARGARRYCSPQPHKEGLQRTVGCPTVRIISRHLPGVARLAC